MSTVQRDTAPVKPLPIRRPVLPLPKPRKPAAQRKPLAPVTPAFQWISKPLLPTNPQDSGQPGLLIIGSKCYLLTAHVHSNGEDEPAVVGWRLTQADGTVYDIDADGWTCDCPDATFRSNRPGPNGHGSNCRHAVGLRQALQLLDRGDDRQEYREPEVDPFVSGDVWDSCPFADDVYTLADADTFSLPLVSVEELYS